MSADPELLPFPLPSRLLAAVYSPGALRRRLEDHPIYLACDGAVPVAFVDAYFEDGRQVVGALSTLATHRRRGAASALLERVIGSRRRSPVVADILLGDYPMESFAEDRGFVPAETVHIMLYGSDLVERRWWLAPGGDPPSEMTRSQGVGL